MKSRRPGPTDLYGGKPPREVPLYSIPVAARIVRVNKSTLRAWVLGRSYPTRQGLKPWEPLIRIADRKTERLSFANLVEVHVLSILRGKQVRVERIREATRFIRDEIGTSHPLADVDTHTDSVDIYVEYLDRLVNASSPQTHLRPLVERYLQRIERDEKGLASRLYPITRDDAGNAPSILIDPVLRFGRPVLAATNLETSVVADRFFAGESTESLAADFRIATGAVEDAIRFETQLRAA
jgi:uncharacterized protein (DUF433 family)